MKRWESHLRWFGHVQTRAINALVRNSKLIQVEGNKKGRGRPKITLLELIKKKGLINLWRNTDITLDE